MDKVHSLSIPMVVLSLDVNEDLFDLGKKMRTISPEVLYLSAMVH